MTGRFRPFCVEPQLAHYVVVDLRRNCATVSEHSYDARGRVCNPLTLFQALEHADLRNAEDAAAHRRAAPAEPPSPF